MKESSDLFEGQSFGELSLVTDKPRAATCYAKEGGVTCCILQKSDYNKFIGETFRKRLEHFTDALNKFSCF